MKRPFLTAPVSPFPAALGVCLPYAVNSFAQLELAHIVLVAVLALLIAAALILLLRWFVGSVARAAICATAVIYVCFTLPRMLDASALPDVVIATVLLVAVAGLVGLAIALRRSSDDYPFAHLVLNGVMFGLLVFPVLHLARNIPAVAIGRIAATEIFPDLPPPRNPPQDAGQQPDVWHIVMDRYANQDSLAKVYSFDNTPFLDALRQRGFAVAERARSNYQRTAHSLASTLNLDYLDGMSHDPRIYRADFIPMYRAIHDSRIARIFDAAGYHMVQVASWWEATRRGRYEDQNLSYQMTSDFVRLILEQSIFGWALSETGITDGRLAQCRRLQSQFDAMEELSRDTRPKHVFAHLLLPHPPFVMTARGTCKSKAEAEQETRRDNYIDQVVYANDALIALIDHVLAGPRPAVILLHADEGPWPNAMAGDETELGLDITDVDWSKATPAQLREKIGILLAVKGVKPGDLAVAPDATPVNLYRQLLNVYFGYDLPLLPDASYVFRDRTHLYDFIDVTEDLR